MIGWFSFKPFGGIKVDHLETNGLIWVQHSNWHRLRFKPSFLVSHKLSPFHRHIDRRESERETSRTGLVSSSFLQKVIIFDSDGFW